MVGQKTGKFGYERFSGSLLIYLIRIGVGEND